MLNPKDVLYQARDKQRENLHWIKNESELRKAFDRVEPQKEPQQRKTRLRLVEILKSLLLLKWPVLGHK